MASSVGWSSVARYALPVVIGGALLLGACPKPAPRRQPDIVRSWHPIARSAPAPRPRDGAASFER